MESIAHKKIKTEKDGKNYTIVLEDKRIHNYLDSILKKELGITFDRSFNEEIITLKIADFYKLCAKVIEDLCGKTGIKIDEIENKITKQKQTATSKNALNMLLKGITTIAGKVLQFSLTDIAEAASKVWTYFQSWQA